MYCTTAAAAADMVRDRPMARHAGNAGQVSSATPSRVNTARQTNSGGAPEALYGVGTPVMERVGNPVMEGVPGQPGLCRGMSRFSSEISSEYLIWKVWENQGGRGTERDGCSRWSFLIFREWCR